MKGIPALLRRCAKDAADPVGVCVNGHVHCVVNRNCCSSGHQVRARACVGTSGVAPIRLKCTRGSSNAARPRPTRKGEQGRGPSECCRATVSAEFRSADATLRVEGPITSRPHSHSTLHRIAQSDPFRCIYAALSQPHPGHAASSRILLGCQWRSRLRGVFD